jgi:hypothetical protein
MAIQSASEFEAVINKVLMRAQRVLGERGSVPSVEGAIRDLQRLFDAARKPAELRALRPALEQVTELLGKEIPEDSGLLDQLWDLADFIDYSVR